MTLGMPQCCLVKESPIVRKSPVDKTFLRRATQAAMSCEEKQRLSKSYAAAAAALSAAIDTLSRARNEADAFNLAKAISDERQKDVNGPWLRVKSTSPNMAASRLVAGLFHLGF